MILQDSHVTCKKTIFNEVVPVVPKVKHTLDSNGDGQVYVSLILRYLVSVTK